MTTVPPGRYLLLGASGLVGSHALVALRGQPGVSVRAVGGRRLPTVSGPNIEALSGDLTDAKFVSELVHGVDFLFLFAGVLSTAPVLARDPLASVLTTLRLSVSAIEAAWRAGVRRCVWLSSTCGYPSCEGPLVERQMFEGEPPSQWHALGWMTRYVETLCETVATRISNTISVVVLRPSLIYGEYDHFDEATAHFLPSLVRRVVARERPIEVWGNGNQSRDLIHAADVVAAALSGLTVEEPFVALNVAAGRSYSVNEILSKLLAIDGFSDAEIIHVGGKPQTAASRQFDTHRAFKVLRWCPQVTLDDGLTRTVAWYRQAHAAELE